MSQDLRRSRKLREMFRRFQSGYKEESDEDDEEKPEEKPPVQARTMPSPGARTIPSPQARRMPSPQTRTVPSTKATPSGQRPATNVKRDNKPPYSSLPCEPSQRPEESEMSAEQKSASERKRLKIRVKYGISERDEECYRKAEDQEQFENVNAVARPAATKMRTRKLKWKKKEEEKDPLEVSARGADKGEKSFADLSDELVEEGSSSEPGSSGSQEQDKLAQIKRRAGLSMQSAQSAEGGMSAETTLTEMRILIIRIEELELANKKLTLQMKRLRKQLREKNKKIEELTSLNAFLKKSSTAEEVKEEEKPTPHQEAIALRGLEIMQRNHLLEDTLYNQERTTLCEFFEAADQKPTQTIVMLIDKALSYAIDVILMRPDMFDDVVDNELRIFLLDTSKAKHILLDVMLLHPEFVPQTWGGGILLKRKQQAVADAEQKRHATVAEDQTVRDDDITDSAAQKQKTPVAPQRKVEASPQKVLKSPVTKVEPREKKSSSESLVGKTDKEKPPVKAELKPSPIRRAPSKAEKKTVEPAPPPKKSPTPTPAPAPQPLPNHNKPTTPAPAVQPLPNHNNVVAKQATQLGMAAVRAIKSKSLSNAAAPKPPGKNGH